MIMTRNLHFHFLALTLYISIDALLDKIKNSSQILSYSAISNELMFKRFEI